MFGAYLFALSAYLSTAGANIGIGLMLLAAMFDIRQLWDAYKQTAMFRVMVWVLIAVSLSSGLGALRTPELGEAMLDSALDLLKLWIFLLVAWWIKGHQQRILTLLALMAIGFILGVSRAMLDDHEDFIKYLTLDRPSFGFGVNAFGQYAAVVFAGLFIAAPGIWRWLESNAGIWRWPAGLLVGFCSFACLYAVIGSKSRSAWLVLTVVVGTYCVLIFTDRKSSRRSRILISMAFAGVAILATFFLAGNEALQQRFAFLNATLMHQIGAGDFANITYVPIRERLVLLQIGFEYWWQKPWFGWGFAATSELIMAHSDQLVNAEKFSDLHNIVADLMLSLGLFGTLAMMSWFVLIFHALFQAEQHRCIEKEVYRLLVAILAIFLLCQLTDFRLLTLAGRFFWALVAGVAFSCYLTQYRSERAS